MIYTAANEYIPVEVLDSRDSNTISNFLNSPYTSDTEEYDTQLSFIRHKLCEAATTELHLIYKDIKVVSEADGLLSVVISGPPPEYPSIGEQAFGFMKTVKNALNQAIHGGPITVPKDVAEARMALCNACEAWDPSQGRCTKCGCQMAVKTELAAATCPLEKWGAYNP